VCLDRGFQITVPVTAFELTFDKQLDTIALLMMGLLVVDRQLDEVRELNAEPSRFQVLETGIANRLDVAVAAPDDDLSIEGVHDVCR
jgi:hypothetical protein